MCMEFSSWLVSCLQTPWGMWPAVGMLDYSLPPLQGDWPLMPSFLLLRTANLVRRHRWPSLPRLVLLRTQTQARIHPLALQAHRSTVKARHENTRSPRNPASSPRNFGAARGFNAARRNYA